MASTTTVRKESNCLFIYNGQRNSTTEIPYQKVNTLDS
jgi:hypothetical protein